MIFSRLTNCFTVFCVCFILFSCTSIKEYRSDMFFKKWKKHTESLLSKINVKTELEKNLKEIINMELANYELPDNKKHFPNLEYIIFPEYVKVSMYKHEPIRSLDISNRQGEIFIDSLFKSNIVFDKLKVLILTKKYKRKLPKEKLFYGFGSYFENVNKKNAKVILERPLFQKGEYIPPVKISKVSFNQTLDTVHLFIYNLHSGKEKRYVKSDQKWKFLSFIKSQ